jgi:hypothetical protein
MQYFCHCRVSARYRGQITTQQGRWNHPTRLAIEIQHRILLLQQTLHSSTIGTDMGQIKSPTNPVLACFVIFGAVEIDGMVVGLSRDPLKFFSWVWLFGLPCCQYSTNTEKRDFILILPRLPLQQDWLSDQEAVLQCLGCWARRSERDISYTCLT